ncbi:glycerate kinase isoform X2 [Wyeomyia smithii]|uniref:glycerate kinase isoform X2 n=1 Tax=Wyeomyia smithii TaxID=174621 RepID=UPI002467C3D4|nr:glycerate kinase isoform X2 [Wyeomyia smithii]
MQTFLRGGSNLNPTGYRLNHVMASAVESTLKILFLGAVDAVKPKALFESYLRNNTPLSEQLQVPDKRYHLVGFGKAVLGMAVHMERLLGDRLKDRDFQLSDPTKLKVFECARNNLPDREAVDAAKIIKSFAKCLTKEDILCVLISGGGSALLSLPKEPVSLQEKLFIIKQLVAAGASIDELNTIRIQLSDVKGGKLAFAAKNTSDLISFVISDIIGDPIPLIASGPTAKNNTTRQAALEILQKYDLNKKLPLNVKQVLNSSLPEPDFDIRENIHLVGSNQVAIKSIVQNCQNTSLTAIKMSTTVEGNVKDICREYIELASLVIQLQRKLINTSEFIYKMMQFKTIGCSDLQRNKKIVDHILENIEKDLLLVFGGEPTVIIKGSGVGGRNQELALLFSHECFERRELLDQVRFLSAGTDGIDGPTDAAGAIGGACVIECYEQQGLTKPVEQFIEENDSYNFYRNVKNGLYHIVTGHTGTNVMDIHLLYIPKDKRK